MRIASLAIVILFVLAGCAAQDRQATTSFKPAADGTFEYSAVADASYPLGSADAEATRIAWLEQYLLDNGYCPAGYNVTRRTPVLVSKGALADIYRVHYIVACSGA